MHVISNVSYVYAGMSSVKKPSTSQSCCSVLLFQTYGKSCSPMFMTQTVPMKAALCAYSVLLDCVQKCNDGLLQLLSAMSRPKTKQTYQCVS